MTVWTKEFSRSFAILTAGCTKSFGFLSNWLLTSVERFAWEANRERGGLNEYGVSHTSYYIYIVECNRMTEYPYNKSLSPTDSSNPNKLF